MNLSIELPPNVRCDEGNGARPDIAHVPLRDFIKLVMGFRQFSLRGLAKVKGQGNLLTLAWTVKRMFALIPV